MGASYATLQNVRDSGITVAQCADATVTDRLEIASRMVDDYCGVGVNSWAGGGWFAAATPLSYTVRDVRNPLVILPRPFASITAVTVNSQTIDVSGYLVEPWGLRLYNEGFLDADGFPRRTATSIGYGSRGYGSPFGSGVTVAASFGWATQPTPTRQATVLITAYLIGQQGVIPLDRRLQRLSVEGYLLQYDDKGQDEVMDTTGVPDADKLLQAYKTNALQIA